MTGRNQASKHRLYFELADGTTVSPFEDYGWRLASISAPPPEPRLYRVDVDGRDGAIDMTEWAGQVHYKDRKVTIGFRGYANRDIAPMYALTGKAVKIHRSDSEYIYDGRVDKIEAKGDFHKMDLTVTCTCYPYAKRMNQRYKEFTYLGGNMTVSSDNGSFPLVFIIDSEDPIYMYHGDDLYTFEGSGTYAGTGLVVSKEESTFSFSPEGLSPFNVTIQWAEEVLI